MIDHIGFAISNMEQSKTFYLDALRPLGIDVIMEVSAEQTGADAHAGFGKDNKASSGSAQEKSQGAARMWRSQRKRGRKLICSTAPLWRLVDGTMARQG